MNALTPIAVQHGPVLRALNKHKRPTTLKAMADQVGVDPSNLRRAFGLLEREGLVAPLAAGETFPALTEAGHDALKRIGLAEQADRLDADAIALRHDQLALNPLNPRSAREDDEDIPGLADTIAEQGVLQALLVAPDEDGERWTIYAGSRRWRAIRLLIADGRWAEGRLIPCRAREPDPALALYVALVENGRRRSLTELEEADALRSLSEAQGWSARETAKRVGMADRVVQIRIKVAREATQVDRDAYTRGLITWAELVDTVQQRRPETAIADTGEDGREGAVAPSDPVDLTPYQALGLVELADKCLRFPAPGVFGHNGYALIERSQTLLILSSRGLAEVVPSGGQTWCARPLPPAKAWLAENGFDDNRAALLKDLRRRAGFQDVDDVATGVYLSAWLQPKKPDTKANSGSSARTREDTAELLSPAQKLILAELADKIDRDPAEDIGRGYTEVARDFDSGRLVLAGCAGFLYNGGHDYRTYGSITSTGRGLLEQMGWLEDRPARHTWLDGVRLVGRGAKACAEAKRTGKYSTPWLNGPFEPNTQPQAEASPAGKTDALPRREALLLIELAHKIEREPDNIPEDSVPAQGYWLDSIQPKLVARGLIRFFAEPGESWRCGFTQAGFGWLGEHGFLTEHAAISVPDEALERAKAEAAETSHPGYVTPWLRPPMTRELAPPVPSPSDIPLQQQLDFLLALRQDTDELDSAIVTAIVRNLHKLAQPDDDLDPHCRICGCTDEYACHTAFGPCSWIEDDLCSAEACQRAAGREPIGVDDAEEAADA